MIFCTLITAAIVGWGNLAETNHVGGRVTSEGYLRGKTVLCYRGDFAAKGEAKTREELQEFWSSYKRKNFVLLADPVNAVEDNPLDAHGTTFPLYRGATITGYAEAVARSRFLVVSAAGRLVYAGNDSRRAMERAVEAMTDEVVPPTAASCIALAEYERDHLPGKALNRLEDFKQRFPEEAQAYWDAHAWCSEFSTNAVYRKLANLETSARMAKDSDVKSRRKHRITKPKIEAVIGKYGDLRQSDDPIVVQEAKNCLADLKWAAAEMGK